MGKISTRPMAGVLTGFEELPAVQGGTTKKLTTAAIAALGQGVGIEGAAVLAAVAADLDASVRPPLTRLFHDNASLAEITAIVQDLVWTVGESIDLPLYGGGRWTVQSDEILQNHFGGEPLQSSKVDFDDELDIQVDLVGGGTGVLVCNLNSIQGFVTNEVTRLRQQLCARFGRKISLPNLGGVIVSGDSISYGQNNPALVGGDQVPTGFGDGSMHSWTQSPNNWPSLAEDRAAEILGAGKLPFTNRSFSGDRTGSAYKRQRFAVADFHTISVIALVTNDILFGSNNGINPELLFTHPQGFTFDRFVYSARKFIYREVIRGRVPIICGPFVWNSLFGYDGTPQSAGKIGTAFGKALRGIADEIGGHYVDWRNIINGRDVATMTFDGVHLADAGSEVLAPCMIAEIFGYIEGAKPIYGPTQLMPLPHFEAMNGPSVSGAGDMQMIDNSNSFGKPFSNPTNGSDLILSPGETRFFFVETLIDDMAVVPVATILDGGTLTAAVDFGVPQGKGRLILERGAVGGAFVDLPASKAYVNATGLAMVINHAGSAANAHLRIQGQGMHIIALSAAGAAIVLHGLSFDHQYGKIGMAIANANIAHAFNPVFDRAELEAAFNAMGGKLNAVLERLRDRSVIATI